MLDLASWYCSLISSVFDNRPLYSHGQETLLLALPYPLL